MASCRAVLNGEVVKDEEFEHVRADGERRYIAANSAPVRNDRGEIIAGVVAFQDVTELRETQQRLLLKSEEKYRDLVDLSPDAIFIVNSEGNFVSANPAGLELLKCTTQELTGMAVSDTYLPEERGAFRALLEEMKTETTIRFERTLLRPDGTTLPVEVSISPVRHGYIQTVVRDISERKRSEAALAKAFKEIQTLKDQLQNENVALREEIDKASMFEENRRKFSCSANGAFSRIQGCSHRLERSGHRRNRDGQGTDCPCHPQAFPTLLIPICERELRCSPA